MAGPASASSAGAPSQAALSDRSGLRAYYVSKLDELELVIRDKSQNLRRLAAQRSALNTKGETGEKERREGVTSTFVFFFLSPFFCEHPARRSPGPCASAGRAGAGRSS